jgi:hypothetical protein
MPACTRRLIRTGICLALLAAAWSCSKAATPAPEGAGKAAAVTQPAAPAAAPAPAAPTSLQVTAARTMQKVLLGNPSGGGMVTLDLAEAPAGRVFLVLGFRSPAPATATPALEGPGRRTWPLRSYVTAQGADDAVAIFEVPVKQTRFVLRHGEWSAPVDVPADTKKEGQ